MSSPMMSSDSKMSGNMMLEDKMPSMDKMSKTDKMGGPEMNNMSDGKTEKSDATNK